MSDPSTEVGLDGRPITGGHPPVGAADGSVSAPGAWRGAIASGLSLLALGSEAWGGGSRLGAVGLVWLGVAGLPAVGALGEPRSGVEVAGLGPRRIDAQARGRPILEQPAAGGLMGLGLALPWVGVAWALDRRAGIPEGNGAFVALTLLTLVALLGSAAVRAERALGGGVRALHGSLWWFLVPGAPLLRYALDDAAQPGNAALPSLLERIADASPLAWIHGLFVGSGAGVLPPPAWESVPFGAVVCVGVLWLTTAWGRR